MTFKAQIRRARIRLAKSRLRKTLNRLAWGILWPRTELLPMYYAPGHYSSPFPSRRDVDEQARIEIAGIDLHRDRQLLLLAELNVVAPIGPRFGPNGFFANTDAAVYQAMIRHHRPTRVIEIGCGYSTAALFDAGGAPDVTLIEPFPDRLREVLTREDVTRCTLLERRLQDVPLSTFQALDSGDVLFVDSTHVTKLGSDVNRLFFEILPALSSGVLVHIHDVYYPFEYPEQWTREGRGWNEAYILRAFLEYNDAFEILLWLDMLRTTGDLAGDCGSIWLRKVRQR